MINILDYSLFANNNDRMNTVRKSLLKEKVKISDSYLNFDKDYFDGGSDFPGYGKYIYDGRYKNKIEDFVKYFNLKCEDNIIEFGCAKGYILYEFYIQGYKKIIGVDYSLYAINESNPDIRNFLYACDAAKFIAQDRKFDMIISKEMIPHLSIPNIKDFFVNLNKISSMNANIYFEIQYGSNEVENNQIATWDPTHKSLLSIESWMDLLKILRVDLNIVVYFKKLFIN
jgi:protein-L-isoaspartate(D-aspartate) O-methyltransferase